MALAQFVSERAWTIVASGSPSTARAAGRAFYTTAGGAPRAEAAAGSSRTATTSGDAQ